MVERIRTLLQARQLSPTQFADAIGVARPIVSHILSGRNKPSLEVVQKVIGAFPELSLPWLLSGTGPMIANSGPVAAAPPAEVPVSPPKASASQEVPLKRPRTVATPASSLLASRIAEPAPKPAKNESVEVVPSQAGSTPLVVPSLQPEPALAAAPPAQPSVQSVSALPGPDKSILAFAEPGKKIRRIVIFYQDGTFADYQPE